MPCRHREEKTLDPNKIAADDATDSNSGITHTIGVCYGRDAHTPIFTPINPTPKTESDNQHKSSEDDDEDNNDDDGTLKEFKIPEEDKPYPFKIYNDNEDSDNE